MNETTDVKLFCNATGNPTPKITWTFLKDSTNVERGEHLFLQQVKRAHAGRYRCTATNHVRNPAWADVHLLVNCKSLSYSNTEQIKEGKILVKSVNYKQTRIYSSKGIKTNVRSKRLIR